eukprot:10204606-Alexandrium_andersonii.AAC.1
MSCQRGRHPPEISLRPRAYHARPAAARRARRCVELPQARPKAFSAGGLRAPRSAHQLQSAAAK